MTEAKDIAVGKCYVTAAGQVRRVLAIEDNKITYESRGKKAVESGKIWGPKVAVPADQFAVLVEKEVREDYDPNYEQSDR